MPIGGFAFAEVEPRTQINPEGRLVDVAFIIKRGPPVYFDKVVINGNTKTRDHVIRRELEMSEKDGFSSDKIKESRNALQRTGYFKNVKVSTKKGEKPGLVDLLVDVEEGPTGTFSVGAGYSTGNSFSFSAALSEGNLFGTGRRLSTTLEIGYHRSGHRAELHRAACLGEPGESLVGCIPHQVQILRFHIR